MEFIEKLDKAFDQLKAFPASTVKSDVKKGLHTRSITKQSSVFYYFDSENIKVVSIFDNRLDPERLKNEIK